MRIRQIIKFQTQFQFIPCQSDNSIGSSGGSKQYLFQQPIKIDQSRGKLFQIDNRPFTTPSWRNESLATRADIGSKGKGCTYTFCTFVRAEIVHRACDALNTFIRKNYFFSFFFYLIFQKRKFQCFSQIQAEIHFRCVIGQLDNN